MKKIVFILSVLFIFSSCSSKYEKGWKILEKGNANFPSLEFYGAFARQYERTGTNPVSFAKGIVRGDYDETIEQWFPISGRVPIKVALDNKWVRLGMTYDEIKQVCGSGSETTYSGRLDHVAYSNVPRGCAPGPNDTCYMLYFYNGELDHINTF